MERSKCVICGKVRYRNKLIKINDLWVCKYSNNPIFFNNVGYHISECQIKLIRIHSQKIESEIILLSKALNQTGIIRMQLMNKIVSPDLTLLLQKICEDK